MRTQCCNQSRPGETESASRPPRADGVEWVRGNVCCAEPYGGGVSGPAGRIFLSYRRDAARHLAGRLADRIDVTFGSGSVFMDVDMIAPGADFRDVIIQAVSSCAVLLAIVDPHWLEVVNEKGQRRLDDPDDLIVLEIGTALRRDVVVVPILVDGARMPPSNALPRSIAALARRNAIRLDHESFPSDSARLMSAIGRALHAPDGRVKDLVGPPPNREPRTTGSAAASPPAERTVRLPRVDIAVNAPGPQSGGGPLPVGRAVPHYRRALLVLLWLLLFFTTILTAVGCGLSFGPTSTIGLGGGVAVTVVLAFGIFGLWAFIRFEMGRQQRLLDRVAQGPGTATRVNSVSPAMWKTLHIAWASLAVLFFLMALLFPNQNTAGGVGS
jgi:TIR domain